MFHEEEYEARIDYLAWIRRIVGWDALLPLVISASSIGIARLLQRQPPADIYALVGLPMAAFVLRFVVGYHQITKNACGKLVRRLQFATLLLAISALVLVDFFVALFALVGARNGSLPNEIRLACSIAMLVYLSLITVAMYPGRRTPARRFHP